MRSSVRWLRLVRRPDSTASSASLLEAPRDRPIAAQLTFMGGVSDAEATARLRLGISSLAVLARLACGRGRGASIPYDSWNVESA